MIMKLFSAIIEQIEYNKILSFCSLVFFIFIAVIIVSKPLRKKFVTLYRPIKPSSTSSIYLFDGLRGIAAVWIVCFHTWQWLRPYNNSMEELQLIRHGHFAVPVFVILSGYLVYRSINDRLNTFDDFFKYIKRRFFRIYPLYFASIIFSAFMGYLSFSWKGMEALLSEVFMLRAFGYPGFVNPPSWSLYVEVLFYIWLPFWVIATNKYKMSALIAAIIITSFIGIAEVIPRELLLMKYFFIGILITEITNSDYYKNLNKLIIFGFFIIGLITMMLSIMLGDFIIVGLIKLLSFLGMQPIVISYSIYSFSFGVGVAFFILGTMRLDLLTRLFSSFIFGYLASISYSLFLLHGYVLTMDTGIKFNGKGTLTGSPFLQTNGNLLTLLFLYLPTFFLLASITYVIIERPFLNLKFKQKI